MKPDVVIYHDPCLDGIVAAWAIWRRWPDVELVPANYGQAPPDVTGKRVLIVDFSYKRDVLVDMSFTAAGIVVLDHHKTANEDLAPFIGLGAPFEVPLTALFDMERSGARLAWDYADESGDEPPRLVQHVEDRDLWRFALPHTREITAYLFSLPFTVEAMGRADMRMELPGGLEDVIGCGRAILQQHDKDVVEIIATSARTIEINGVTMECANAPKRFSSDVAGALAERHTLGIGASYFDGPTHRHWSLRSRKGSTIECNRIAEAFGGGGHPGAAGFQTSYACGGST